ncbi:MAG: hypothetical protein OHK0039_18510 [Bacteroidia bacterium]
MPPRTWPASTSCSRQAVWFELKHGECSLHDARIIHGAPANHSDRRRCGYTMRYFALDMKFNPGTAPDIVSGMPGAKTWPITH